ncbi:MAG: hypothetical protein JXA77_02600 [Bacteroidales bacterium]|nr:hypothetical protein [Bacteroidales bacterium]MBN2817830.1 hypothetical protein [Bacteroidales bacterium]
MNKLSLVVIHVFFGELPPWFSLFQMSCCANPEIQFLFFLDSKTQIKKCSNIRTILFSKENFSALTTRKLGKKIELIQSYKLCDFKPMFGKIFDDYIRDYEYWAHCDNDLIFGNISKYLKQELKDKLDILSFYKGFISGPFCIYRNNNLVNTLYSQGLNIDNVLKSELYCGFDENIYQALIKPVLINHIWVFMLYLFSSNCKYLFYGKEYRFQFQWFYKKKLNKKRYLLDITDIVNRAVYKAELSVKFSEQILSDRKLFRLGYKDWKIHYKEHRLSLQESKDEIFIFHFIDLKNELRSKYVFQGKKEYVINKEGIE